MYDGLPAEGGVTHEFARCPLYKYGYISPMGLKPVAFHGDSLERLRDFPEDARRQAGHELYLVQTGADPTDWKPMPTIGLGVREIRLREASGAYRVIYIASLPDAVHVLHAFQKKARKTRQRDLDIAADRLRQLKRRFER
jgi:phage-related protein